MIYDHAPKPGPWPTWDWRCLVCSRAVSDHADFIARWWFRRQLRKIGAL